MQKQMKLRKPMPHLTVLKNKMLVDLSTAKH